MKHPITSMLLMITSGFLASCSQSNVPIEYVRSSYTYGYTQKEVSDLRRKLWNTTFPQQDGYVESLLKNKSGVGMLASTADLLPNDEGILATYTLTYSLNDDFTLIVFQDHYEKSKSPLKTAIIDSKAEIVRHKSQNATRSRTSRAIQPPPAALLR